MGVSENLFDTKVPAVRDVRSEVAGWGGEAEEREHGDVGRARVGSYGSEDHLDS